MRGACVSAERWVSTTDVAGVAERLRSAERVAVFTHLKPDGDAVGSTLALARALTIVGKGATPVYLKPWPARFTAIVGATPVVHERDGDAWTRAPGVADADTVVICDTGSWGQVAGARGVIESKRERAIIIDHHAHGDPEMAPTRLIEVGAAAACEILASVVCELLGQTPDRLPTEIGIPLYLGIATDTGWFRYSNTTASTLRLAAALIESGVRANELYQMVEQCDTAGRVRLIGRAVAGMDLTHDGSVAVITVRQKDLAETGASVDEASGLTDLPQMIESVRVVAVLIEQDDGSTKVSLRSKAGAAEVDVNAAAQRLGGGGHKHAAGARLKDTIESARARVIEAIDGAVR